MSRKQRIKQQKFLRAMEAWATNPRLKKKAGRFGLCLIAAYEEAKAKKGKDATK